MTSNAPAEARDSFCDASRTRNRSSLDVDGLAWRLAAQLHQFAVGIVVGERFIQLVDAGKGGLECRGGLLFRGRIELDAEERPHVGLNHFEGLEGRALRNGWCGE